MIKLTANMSKKVPLEGVDFASKGFSAGVEVEVTDLGDVQGKLRDLYGLLESAIDDEIAGHAPHHEEQQQQVPSARAIIPSSGNGSGNGNARGWDTSGAGNHRVNGNAQSTTRQQSQQPQQRYRSGGNGDQRGGNNGSGNGNNGHRLATAAQVKAIGAIAAASGIQERDLSDMIRQRFDATHAEALTVRDASTLIDHLKQLQAA